MALAVGVTCGLLPPPLRGGDRMDPGFKHVGRTHLFSGARGDSIVRRLAAVLVSAAALTLEAGCGVFPEKMSRDDARLKPMFDAMARIDRDAMGFTRIGDDAEIRVEWVDSRFERLLFGPKNYDVMLHVGGRASRTVAFKKMGSAYEWLGEQETFEGPRKYKTPDGTFNESITIDYERVPIFGFPLNSLAVSYSGEEAELAWPKKLSLDDVRPWLEKWRSAPATPAIRHRRGLND